MRVGSEVRVLARGFVNTRDAGRAGRIGKSKCLDRASKDIAIAKASSIDSTDNHQRVEQSGSLSGI
jgi:hypothetical protein